MSPAVDNPLPSPCQYGLTGWCSGALHHRCPYGPNGQLADGIWLPECYVTVGQGAKARRPLGGTVSVVRPSHIYRCPCECHSACQLGLFGATP